MYCGEIKMTKDKTNDFIKIKIVKDYVKSINGRNDSTFIDELKLKVRELIDNKYKKE